MKLFTKTMASLSESQMHNRYEAITQLSLLNHPMIPQIYTVDNYTYTCEYLEGTSLHSADIKHDIPTMFYYINTIFKFLEEMSKINYSNKYETRYLGFDDVHAGNFMLTKDKQLKIIDFDQVRFLHEQEIYRELNKSFVRLVEFFRCERMWELESV